MKVSKKVKRLLAKFDRQLATLRSLRDFSDDERRTCTDAIFDILCKLEEYGCDIYDFEHQTVLLLEEVSEQQVKCRKILNVLFSFVFRFLEEILTFELSSAICKDPYFLECSNISRCPLKSKYRLPDYVFSKTLNQCWESYDASYHNYPEIGVLRDMVRYGITVTDETEHFIDEVVLNPHLLVDFFIMSLVLYFDFALGFSMNDELEEVDVEGVARTSKDYVLLALRAMQPTSEYMLYWRCAQLYIEEAKVITAIDELKSSMPQIEERIGRKVTSLKHLCRCVIRERLRENWALPEGLLCLDLPNSLQMYIDLY